MMISLDPSAADDRWDVFLDGCGSRGARVTRRTSVSVCNETTCFFQMQKALQMPLLHGLSAAGCFVTVPYLTGEEREWSERYHTLVLVPRCRASTPMIRGGESVNRIHRDYIRSAFWGYAPWYVMQGGVLELLEAREIYRDLETVRTMLATTTSSFVAEPREAAYVCDLTALNFGVTVAVSETGEPSGVLRGRLELLADTELKRFNHATLVVFSAKSAGTEIEHCPYRLLATDCARQIVRLSLAMPDHLSLQRDLYRVGFRLSSVSPPSCVWYVCYGKRHEAMLEVFGLWSRPNVCYEIMSPYYRDGVSDCPIGTRILADMRERL